MQDARSMQVFQALQGKDHLLDVVPVDGTEIPESQGLEEGAARFADQVRLCVLGHLLDGIAELGLAQAVPERGFQPVVGGTGGELQQVIVQGAQVPVDGLVVVVQDNEDVGLGAAGVVQSLKRKAAGHGAVADQGYHLLLASLQPGGLGQAQGSRNGCGRMAGAKGVVRTLVHLGETADALPGAVAFERFATTGQDFVRISLMSHIKDQLVLGGVVHIMHAYDEFHGAQAGTQVPWIHGTARDHIVPYLGAQLPQALHIQPFDVFRAVDCIQNRSLHAFASINRTKISIFVIIGKNGYLYVNKR